MKRQLAAIVAADMAGYSRLMEQDEEGVLARQKTHRQELIDPEIGKRNGRIVKTTGDGLLAEFASAQDAVQCALNIQRGMAGRESGNPIDKRIVYRLGINLGDVIFDEGDVFGDGVNVAARLQTLAIPGGVCVSDIIHQTVGDRLGTAFRDLGIQRVKNISRPVRVWQWSPDTDRAEIEPDELALQQVVRFVTTQDQTQIAWATVGKGSPVLKAPNWLNHLDYEWRSPGLGPVPRRAGTRSQAYPLRSTRQRFVRLGPSRNIRRGHAHRYASCSHGGWAGQVRSTRHFAGMCVLDPLCS